MLEELRHKFRRKPDYNSPFSEFIRNASAREKKKVYEQVMREAIEEQRKLIERAEKLDASKSNPTRTS